MADLSFPYPEIPLPYMPGNPCPIRVDSDDKIIPALKDTVNWCCHKGVLGLSRERLQECIARLEDVMARGSGLAERIAELEAEREKHLDLLARCAAEIRELRERKQEDYDPTDEAIELVADKLANAAFLGYWPDHKPEQNAPMIAGFKRGIRSRLLLERDETRKVLRGGT